jgi:hypothetical protein
MCAKRPRVGEAAQILYGFRIQEFRFLTRLLEAKPGDVVWIEYFDDVGVSKGDGITIVEQDTTSLTGNPLQNRAEKIWKTLANWVLGANADWYDPEKSEFVLYLPQVIKPGSLVQQIIDANDEQSAKTAIIAVSDTFWGASPSFPKKSLVSETLKEHLNVLLTNQDTAAKIIEKFRVETGGGNGVLDGLYKAIDAWLGFPKGKNRRAHFIKKAIGHHIVETTPTLEEGQLIAVKWEEFNEFARGYVQEHLRPDYLASISTPPTEEEVGEVLSSSPVFVQQLKALDWDTNDIIQEINNYLRAVEDVAGWGEDTEISASQFSEFENYLIGFWRAERNAIRHDGLSPVQFGNKIAGRCLAQKFEMNGRKIDYHITPGTYHDLADGDGKTVRIRWNPSFIAPFENDGGE